jgi:S-adenosylmethionine:tRNA ribosyltransferase-isomerase
MRESIRISDFTYTLPEERIASFPLESRDNSKLLFYNRGEIQHLIFKNLPDLLPTHCVLLFNDTRVIPARLIFQKETGADIEIFLLKPFESTQLLQQAMEATGIAKWKCVIGNLKRWTNGLTLTKKINSFLIHATLLDRQNGVVEFSWTPSNSSFAEIINQFGATPLPPYIKRQAGDIDQERYQTVYSHYKGAVAAPTAGLHFTDEVMAKIKQKGIDTDFLTLHVSAGTFQPIKTENATDHTMHSEQIIVKKETIQKLLSGKKTIAVGTTSMRTLESLYWFGVKLLQNSEIEFIINQNDPYLPSGLPLPSKRESLNAVLQHMDFTRVETLVGSTSIFILPGYSFKICEGLITNFHQPGSTLMLLVAAFVGDDWKKIYEAALSNNYRFLSYGDSSLLLPKHD